MRRIAPVNRFLAWLAALAVRIGLDQADIRGKAFASHQALHDAAAQNRVEQLTGGSAIAETTMPVLGEAGVIRHFVFQAEQAEPAVGYIVIHFFAKTACRTNAVAIANDEHANGQLGVNRRSASVALKSSDMRTKLAQIEIVINGTQKMIFRNIFVETDGNKILPLRCLAAHHGKLQPISTISLHPRLDVRQLQGSFSTE